jgi:hypothetical protein
LRSENQELFKELEWIKAEHKAEIKVMEASSELAVNKQLEEINSLKTSLEKAKKLTEDNADALKASREQSAEY